MNVIVFASRKGGSGKSTLAAHLAAHVHKSTKPCLMVDGDPQGSLTLWHKLRGTNEPPIRTAVRSVGEIIAAAKRDGIEWVDGELHAIWINSRPVRFQANSSVGIRHAFKWNNDFQHRIGVNIPRKEMQGNSRDSFIHFWKT